mmetsp:Transcript_3134/g.6727  ORF Transcript_3134/g.6727 Transcript_3134/m.6727 type:complete len:276 (-) Transcript_3134:195-1022(-)
MGCDDAGDGLHERCHQAGRGEELSGIETGECGGLLHAFPRALQGAPRRVPQGRGDVRGLAPNSGARAVGWQALTQESPQGVRALLRVAPADLCRVRSRRQAVGGHRRRTHGLAARCRRLQDELEAVDRLWPRSVATAQALRVSVGRERCGHVPAAERAQEGVASFAPHSPVHAEAFPRAPNSPPLGEAEGKASGARDAATSEAAACPLNAMTCALEMSATDIPPSRSDTVARMSGGTAGRTRPRRKRPSASLLCASPGGRRIPSCSMSLHVRCGC